ncbi:MAG: DUF1653 domain-containing protein [Candidatus Doudnabacteria bacterium]|nr:DUF1653 domain-containing protein [Candidatus Doudnabacteria bacterium]
MKHELSEQAKALKHGIYQHYKGGIYQVLGVCRHSETLEEMVVYMPLYGEYQWWVRPLGMFFDSVENNGEVKNRFNYLGQNH